MARTDDLYLYSAKATRLWSVARTSNGSKQCTQNSQGHDGYELF